MKDRLKISLIDYMMVSLFLLKGQLFYQYLEIANGYGKLLLISLLYFVFLRIAIGKLFQEKDTYWLYGLYSLLSIIMFCDVVYFEYFHQMPSIKFLGLASQLNAVAASVKYLIQPKHWLFLSDLLPLWIFMKKRKEEYFTIPMDKGLVYQDKKLLSLCMAMMILLFIKGDFVEKLLRQELLTYHINDIYSSMIAKADDQVGDYGLESYLLQKRHQEAFVENRKDYGIAKGRNLIIIQVESLQNFVINKEYNGQEITPHLNRLLQKDSIYFDRYYQQLGKGNTSDAEFVSNNSLYPAMDGVTYDKYGENDFYGLPWILRDNSYSASAFHGHDPSYWNREKAYPNQGFERFYHDVDYTIGDYVGFGLTDRDFFHQSLDYLKDMKQPFYAFMITLTSHHPYVLPEYYDTIRLKKEHKDTLFGNYLRCVHYTDAAIGAFIEELKKEGLYENSVIVVYGDHYGLSSKHSESAKIMTEYLGKTYDFDEMFRIPLIFHIPGTGVVEKNSTTGGQIDFMPTVLNFMGIDSEKAIMLGQDLSNASEGFVAHQTYMVKGSYFNDHIAFEMSRDGIYGNSRAWYIRTQQPIDLELCREGYERALKEIGRSDYILRNNLVRQLGK
ncbi:phosphoglycerol transferase MdoB-like AlkP superfamily enzyme [Anaerosolibacter carboniphilus]|uniref:Phosphoglycerol transferase MdoB-like AlkP superfamily enzyme n=1 Tax=Anaerosolibacter carboniphilus TaxID=1417629 RepID=A0A841KQA5_9FIRM|nr:LTA synthase family protein [Anaerosolibacter carboniphilus]MBB6215607.1 phosphoglycerol transferase MdoB-like AlkP superfamily enzyme [Anaerosolibacter carboniphilus]